LFWELNSSLFPIFTTELFCQCVSPKPFYIGSSAEKSLELEAVIYADNLPDPRKVKLTIEFEIENRLPLTIDDL